MLAMRPKNYASSALPECNLCMRLNLWLNSDFNIVNETTSCIESESKVETFCKEVYLLLVSFFISRLSEAIAAYIFAQYLFSWMVGWFMPSKWRVYGGPPCICGVAVIAGLWGL